MATGLATHALKRSLVLNMFSPAYRIPADGRIALLDLEPHRRRVLSRGGPMLSLKRAEWNGAAQALRNGRDAA